MDNNNYIVSNMEELKYLIYNKNINLNNTLINRIREKLVLYNEPYVCIYCNCLYAWKSVYFEKYDNIIIVKDLLRKAKFKILLND